MTRNAFKMKLKPGNVTEYKKRHDEIWPELQKELRAAGISDYSIFLDEETLTLFAMQKLSEKNSANDLPNSPIVRNRCAKFFISPDLIVVEQFPDLAEN